MTGPTVPHELRPAAGAGIAAQRRVTGGSCGAGSRDDPPIGPSHPRSRAPNSGDGISAPPPHEAYASAPDLRREIHQVLALGAERDGRQARPVTGSPVDSTVAERTLRLRRAALMDRMALDDPGPGPIAAATATAEQLVLLDRSHPELVAGPHFPDAIALAPRRRLYVRQEYAAWTAAGRPGT
ncbi:hypothetical protein ACF07Y_27755 [Streptomyces sp. NPDC016566]|uniref:hypothetical protein n=1 Tax=Streptomyces sp. NPDC016566 TaxID=3364967 RepID=UPI0036FC3F4E